MNFAQLRNGVEQVAAQVAKVGVSTDIETGEVVGEETDEVIRVAVLTAGMCLVGIYEELAGIRHALGQGAARGMFGVGGNG